MKNQRSHSGDILRCMHSHSPLAPRVENEAAPALREWLAEYRSVFVLTGAGVSTNSGIPDYRGPDGEWKRRAPITYQAFTQDPAMRARYWARSFVGWPVVAAARPNRAHAALATLESRGRLSMLVTQNVDGLHERAGHAHVVDLHGRIDQVICLACDTRTTRAAVQERLAEANPHWLTLTAGTAPDGDADLEDADFNRFQPPSCTDCGGTLKPDVVFFGENVPRQRVQAAADALHGSDAMGVAGATRRV